MSVPSIASSLEMDSVAALPPSAAADLLGLIKPPSLNNTYGALVLGTVFGLMLYGLTVHQTYRYGRLYPKDSLWLKALVAGILVMETLHITLCIVAVYYHLVDNYFNPLSLLEGHCFYAFRVYQIGSHTIYKSLVAVALVCMVCTFGFMIAATVLGFRLSLNDFQHVSWLVSAIFGCTVLADICLAGTLVVFLLRSRTGSRRTDSLIELLIIYSINTGVLTTIFGLLGFIFAIILPGNLIYIGISVVGVKLYANSVLAVLNSRRSLSRRMMRGLEVGSFEPARMYHDSDCERGAGPGADDDDDPLETWKVRDGRDGTAAQSSMANITFATRTSHEYTVGVDATSRSSGETRGGSGRAAAVRDSGSDEDMAGVGSVLA
ncbi:hypothetical protein C8Q73DRAFT_789360 [Cubamyces lactineus]|nr:hypothetical protein C8Q73DRAFT_789360 [Cubamyces lactineus]